MGVPALKIGCARLTGIVGPLDRTLAAAASGVNYITPVNNPADVKLVKQLINLVVNANYVAHSVWGSGKLATPLVEDRQWNLPLHDAIKEIERLYFHGRANPHGIDGCGGASPGPERPTCSAVRTTAALTCVTFTSRKRT